jgi:hypothetical protein
MTDTILTESLTVQSIVVSTVIDAELDLQPLTEALDGVDYAHQPCPTLTYHPTETAAMIRLFRSGTLLAIGAASRDAARESLRHTIDDLDDLLGDHSTRTHSGRWIRTIDLRDMNPPELSDYPIPLSVSHSQKRITVASETRTERELSSRHFTIDVKTPEFLPVWRKPIGSRQDRAVTMRANRPSPHQPRRMASTR